MPTTTTTRKAETTEAEKDQTIKALAAALGADWSVRPAPDTGIATRTIVTGKGYGCTLHWSTYPAGRIEVSGVWPSTADGRTTYPSQCYGMTSPGITVSAERPIKTLAAEIIRRFLPAYLPVYDKLAERAAGADDYAAKTKRTAAALLAALPGARAGARNHDDATVWLHDNHAHSVTAQGDSVRFEAFSCPADVAIKVLQLLRTGPARALDA
jgi:hypothetical protein